MILLLSKKDLYILLGSMFVFLLFLLYTSNYYLDYNYLLVYKAILFRDYVIESVSFMKFIIVMYGAYISILAKKLHHLDGLYLSRSSRFRIIVSRALVLITYLVVCICVLFAFFLSVGSFLTPIMQNYQYFQLFISIILFGIFYLLLSYLLMNVIKLFYAPLFTMLIYFVGSIFSPYYIDIHNANVFEKVISYIINDLIVFSNNTIAPYYGNFHIIALILVLSAAIISLYHEKDIITL